MAKNKTPKLNIGLIIFAAIFVYMLVNTFLYLGKSHISFFEAEAGKIVDSDTFTGFILRDESVVGATGSGYISYYIGDGQKASVDSYICVIDTTQTENEAREDVVYTADANDYSDIREAIGAFRKNYTDSDYSEVFNLDYKLNNIVSYIVSKEAISSLSSQTGRSGRGMSIMTAMSSGVISYTTDGYEGMTREDMNSEIFSAQAGYERHQLAAGTYVQAGDAAYKEVNNESWEVIIHPSAAQLEKLEACDRIDVTFTRDNITAQADVEVFENEGSTFVSLLFDNYMIRYINERYINIEIVWDSAEGIKIPVSAITQKAFYTIPAAYLVTDDESSEKGFYTVGEGGIEFIKPTIWRQDENYCYIDASAYEPGLIITNLSGSSRYELGPTVSLDGVYNINKGYAVFRLIDILYTYGDYCIIDDSTSYGVTLYDHIALEGDQLSENDIL